MSDEGAHIAAWEAAGLIDGATADRLRAAVTAEMAEPAEPADAEQGAQTSIAKPAVTAGRSWGSTLFGPAPRIAEVFGYLAVGSLLAGWFAAIARIASGHYNPTWVVGSGSGLAAIALIALGVVLARGDELRRRAAGVAFLVALAIGGAAIFNLSGSFGVTWPAQGLVATAVVLATSIALRLYYPAVLTQIGCLAAVTIFAAALFAYVEGFLFPLSGFDGTSLETGINALEPVVLLGAAWLACAILLGAVGVWESRAAERDHDASAARRAGASRLWAGLVAVFGLATALSRTAFLDNLKYDRALVPVIGDLALLVVAGVLLERAFRRESTAYLYAATAGLIVALSDFTFYYVTNSTETDLFAEGLILIGAGVAADQLRRRLGHPGDPDPTPLDGQIRPLPA
jgi:hypothetical protein